MKSGKFGKSGWSPLNTALMVIGFIVFWPLGLAMLAYILWGDELRDMFYDARHQFRRQYHKNAGQQHYSGNTAFDDYRARELKRLEEERDKLNEMREEFETYMRNLRRAKDQEEFDRFMRDRPDDASGKEPDGAPA